MHLAAFHSIGKVSPTRLLRGHPGDEFRGTHGHTVAILQAGCLSPQVLTASLPSSQQPHWHRPSGVGPEGCLDYISYHMIRVLAFPFPLQS